MVNQFSIGLASSFLAILITQSFTIGSAYSQDAQQNATQNSTIAPNSNGNLVIQTPNQNSPQNRNVNEINIPNIYPLNTTLDTPVNTENDLGFNMSVGVNTLDASNVTVFFGLIFQPGRTESHKIRMTQLQRETELLESQKQVSAAQLQLLQKQIAEAEVRLQRLQRSPEGISPKNSSSTDEMR
jgi:hypothetical protein